MNERLENYPDWKVYPEEYSWENVSSILHLNKNVYYNDNYDGVPRNPKGTQLWLLITSCPVQLKGIETDFLIPISLQPNVVDVSNYELS